MGKVPARFNYYNILMHIVEYIWNTCEVSDLVTVRIITYLCVAGKFVRKVRQTFQDRLADASATAEESISNIRTVRSFVAEDKASGAYGSSVDKSYAEGKKLAIAEGIVYRF